MPARGEVWFANLDPTRGTEQAGTRPVILFQADAVNEITSTVLCIPLTTNLRRAALPTCLLIRRTEGGLTDDSVALCLRLKAESCSRPACSNDRNPSHPRRRVGERQMIIDTARIVGSGSPCLTAHRSWPQRPLSDSASIVHRWDRSGKP